MAGRKSGTEAPMTSRKAKRKAKFRVGQRVVITNLEARILKRPDVKGAPWTLVCADIEIPVYEEEMKPKELA
jgi:hypothetical protein